MTTPDQAPRDLIGFLDLYLVKKAPFQIPADIRELLVKFGPWIVLLLLVLSLPTLLLILGIGTAFVPYGGVGYATRSSIFTVALLAQLVMLGMALPGLFKRTATSWKLVFYSQLVGIAASLLGGLYLGALLGAVIGLYILFQIRALYVN